MDEYQRIITTDGISDSQFLDRGRGFGAACIFASQGSSALRERLPAHAGEAVRAILNNLATWVVMATTDAQTVLDLRPLIPAAPMPHLPHLLDVRPPSLFARGTVLWLTAGRYGLGQVELATANSLQTNSRCPDDRATAPARIGG